MAGFKSIDLRAGADQIAASSFTVASGEKLRKFFKFLGLCLLASVLGLGSAGYRIYDIATDRAILNGPWATNPTTGSKEADSVTRAAVAIGGLFALSREETIYYNTFRDSDGDRLTEDCNYQVIGRDPATRWWSITAYAADNYLIRNDSDNHSVAMTTVQRQRDGSYVINVGPDRKAVNWIDTTNGGRFALTLRLYNPEPDVYENPKTTPLPKIVKEGCL